MQIAGTVCDVTVHSSGLRTIMTFTQPLIKFLTHYLPIINVTIKMCY